MITFWHHQESVANIDQHGCGSKNRYQNGTLFLVETWTKTCVTLLFVLSHTQMEKPTGQIRSTRFGQQSLSVDHSLSCSVTLEKKREPFFGKTFLSGAATPPQKKRKEKGRHSPPPQKRKKKNWCHRTTEQCPGCPSLRIVPETRPGTSGTRCRRSKSAGSWRLGSWNLPLKTPSPAESFTDI